jgi:hypothetical protein
MDGCPIPIPFLIHSVFSSSSSRLPPSLNLKPQLQLHSFIQLELNLRSAKGERLEELGVVVGGIGAK